MKFKLDGFIYKYKARLVSKGYAQKNKVLNMRICLLLLRN
jgi:hypothetical protein